MRNKPNKILAPLAIAGITIGFLGAAYKFIFVDSKRTKKEQANSEAVQAPENQKEDSHK